MKKLSLIFLFLFIWQSKLLCQGLPCTIKSDRHAFSLANDTIQILQQLLTNDGGQLLVGKTNVIASSKSDGLLLKLDAAANIVWSRRIIDSRPNESLVFHNAIESADGNYIIGGLSSEEPGNPTFAYYLLKYDITGNVLWQQEYPIDNSLGIWEGINLTGLTEDEDKAIYISGALKGVVPQQVATQFAIILKSDNVGQLKFSKLFYDSDVDLNSFIGIFPSKQNLLIWGSCEDGHNTQSDLRRVYWMQLDAQDGHFQAGKATCFSPFTQSAVSYSMNPHFLKAFKTDHGFSVAGLLAENSATKRAVVNFNFDNQLELTRAWMLPQIPGVISANAGDFCVARNGNLILAQRSNTQNSRLFLSQFDSIGALVVQRQIDGFGAGTGVNTSNGGVRIGMTNAHIYFSANYLHNMVPVCEFLKYNPVITNQDCFGKPTFFGAPQNFSTYPMVATQLTSINNIAGAQPGDLSNSPIEVTSELICTTTVVCSSLTITGPDTVCVFGQPAYYIAHRSQSCTMPIKWLFDSTRCLNANTLNDSTISITWKTLSPGKESTKVIATLDNCTSVSDTLSIALFPYVKPFQPDTALCAGDSLRLSPGAWFKSYRWQDGSTDSVFVAKQPGLYMVTYQTFCGRTITDSVHIIKVGESLLLVDTEKICKGDSIILHAQDGYSNYQWMPDYETQSIASNTVRIFPLTNTTYIVTASLRPGCDISDSVKIIVNRSSEVKILKKAEDCQEAVLSVQSTTGFSEILWSSPSQTFTRSEIKVTKNGIYHLQVKDLNGCRSKDSLDLVLEPCTDHINFPNAFTPNGDGRNDLFRAIVKGDILEYEMSVYNSWGQRVFYSHDFSSGWDGRIAGQLQHNSSFVWVCKYRFQSGGLRIKKGAVVLIN